MGMYYDALESRHQLKMAQTSNLSSALQWSKRVASAKATTVFSHLVVHLLCLIGIQARSPPTPLCICCWIHVPMATPQFVPGECQQS